MRFTIEAAAVENVQVKSTDAASRRQLLRRTDAKKGKEYSVTAGTLVPGFFLKLTRRMNKTTMWLDLEMCVKLGLLPEEAVVNEDAAAMLVGKVIRLRA